MAERVAAEPDLLELLVADHRTVAANFELLDGAAADERQDLFREIAPLLVAHEVAEEQIVYPALQSLEDEAALVVELRLAEEARAEELLTTMERLDPSTETFATSMSELQVMVLDHAAKEEQELFPLFADRREVLDLPTMAVRYQNAKRRAPTHPHPHAPVRAPANLALGPLTSLFDRVRDALH